MKTRSRTNSEAEMNKMLKSVIANKSDSSEDEALDQSFHSSGSEVVKKSKKDKKNKKDKKSKKEKKEKKSKKSKKRASSTSSDEDEREKIVVPEDDGFEMKMT